MFGYVFFKKNVTKIVVIRKKLSDVKAKITISNFINIAS